MKYDPKAITYPLFPCTDTIGSDDSFIGVEMNYDKLIKYRQFY